MPEGGGLRGEKLVREEGLSLVGEGEHTGPPKLAKRSHRVQGAVSADVSFRFMVPTGEATV